MKKFILVLLVSLFCSTMVLAADRWGVEVDIYNATLSGLTYSTSSFDLGGNVTGIYNNFSSNSKNVELKLWANTKTIIDKKSSWGYGLFGVYTLGKEDGKEIEYKYTLAPYLRYDQALIGDNLYFTAYCDLVNYNITKYKNTEELKEAEMVSLSWYLTLLF